MSLDPSLRIKNSLAGVRSVMTRAERMAKLAEDGRVDPKTKPVLGLPKTHVVQK